MRNSVLDSRAAAHRKATARTESDLSGSGGLARRDRFRWFLGVLGTLAIAVAAYAQTPEAAPGGDGDTVHERWQFYQSVPLPDLRTNAPEAATGEPSGWFDFLLNPDVFSDSRADLGDLRLVDARGQEVPYALRIRTPLSRDEQVAARQFNDVTGEGGAAELSYDLGENPPEHNQVEVDLAGDNFRRLAVLFGSDDGTEWLKLTVRQLLRFQVKEPGQHDLDVRRLHYPPARYRYLRLRIERDPLVDREPPIVNGVHVHRRAEVAGEFVTTDLQVQYREPTRASNSPASAWILRLPGRRQPVERLRVKFAETEFARNYLIEAGGDADGAESFQFVQSGEWRGRPEVEALNAEFAAHEAARLRLTIVDHGNPPLELVSAEVQAPARQIVFARRPELVGPLRLYYGNSQAAPPQYDLQRTLPDELLPPPQRLSLNTPTPNPDYVPAPLPVSERLPWLIYVVLGGASVVVAAVLWDVGRRAIERHDAGAAGKASAPSDDAERGSSDRAAEPAVAKNQKIS